MSWSVNFSFVKASARFRLTGPVGNDKIHIWAINKSRWSCFNTLILLCLIINKAAGWGQREGGIMTKMSEATFTLDEHY